jgi:hypothetical protein
MDILRYNIGAAQARIPLTAVGEQKADEAANAAIIGGVKDAAAVLSRADKPRPQKLLQVKRHGRRSDARRFRKNAGRDAARTCPNKALEDVQANLLRKG